MFRRDGWPEEPVVCPVSRSAGTKPVGKGTESGVAWLAAFWEELSTDEETYSDKEDFSDEDYMDSPDQSTTPTQRFVNIRLPNPSSPVGSQCKAASGSHQARA
ncbi:hypothetical protein UPYG_G00177790 [Umbra pygmaea]|uniref:Uncharacterized protein n=1 Tax=Umbra pygmaea TaxID=75934 RepID=A0ABD0XAY9_UMBPY